VTSSLAVLSFGTGKINASHKIMFENQKKCGNKRKFYGNLHLKRLFWNGIHSLLKRADTRGSADIIYRIGRISLVCGSGKVVEVRK